MTTPLIFCLTLILVGFALTRREFQKLAYVKR
jgi:hypothetical protein